MNLTSNYYKTRLDFNYYNFIFYFAELVNKIKEGDNWSKKLKRPYIFLNKSSNLNLVLMFATYSHFFKFAKLYFIPWSNFFFLQSHFKMYAQVSLYSNKLYNIDQNNEVIFVNNFYCEPSYYNFSNSYNIFILTNNNHCWTYLLLYEYYKFFIFLNLIIICF